METIRTYLESLFAALPQTEQVKGIKYDMLQNMEEKYNALKAEGKSENEAIGTVIAEFGSIDEIVQELGIKSEPGAAAENDDNSLFLTQGQVKEFLAARKKAGINIAIGVMLVMIGVASLTLFGNSEITLVLPGANIDILDAFSICALLVLIAVAMAIFIFSGISMSKYESYEKKITALDAKTRADLESKQDLFRPKFAGMIAAGVGLIFVGIVNLFLADSSYDKNNLFSVPILLILIGIAVFFFIQNGMHMSGYDILLGKGEYKNKGNADNADKIIGSVASFYWPLAIAIFLIWGLVFDGFGIAWVVWPVAGVLFGGFSGMISTLKK